MDALDDLFLVDEDGVITGGDLFADNGNGADIGDLVVIEVDGVAANVGTTIVLASGALLTVNADGTFSYDPNGQFEHLGVGATEIDFFTYTVEDINGGGTDTATVTITINGVNDAPVAIDDAFSTDDNVLLSGSVLTDNGLGADEDIDADTLSVSAVNGVGANVGVQITLASGALLTLNADGTYSYDPNGQFEHLSIGETATDSFTYTVSDGNGGTDTATVSLTINGVNSPPVAVADAISATEDAAVIGNLITNDTDVENDPLTVTAVNGSGANVGTQITLASGALLSVLADGSYDYDPNGQFEHLQVGETATDSFTYTISDGQGGTSIGTATVTISGVNDAPVAAADTNTTDEDTAVLGNVLTNDTDVDGDTLTVSEAEGVAGNVGVQITLASGALLTLNANGSYTYDPNGVFNNLQVGESGIDGFSYTVSDGNGGTDTATVTITINGVNDAPVAAADTNSTDENTAVLGSVLTNDTDADGDTLEVSEVNGSAGDVGVQITLASGALLTLNADGSYEYDPNGQFESLQVGETATDSFTYTVSDGNGGTDTATATITINGVNDAPVAVADSNATNEDTNVLGNALTNDTDVESDVLSVSAVNGSALNVGVQITLASGALLSMNANGAYDYDPNGQFESLQVGETGSDSFTYTVSDGNGGTDTETVTITINGVNDAPVAVDDANSTDEATAVLGNVLTNDTDVESDILGVTEVDGSAANLGVQITLASGALLTLNANGAYSYDPNGQFENLAVGEGTTDSFTYTVSDGNGGSDSALVTITINGVNDAPVAVADANSTDEATAVTGNVLTNDTDPDTSDVLTVSAVNGSGANVGVQITLASGALLTLNADGSYEYDPNGQFENLGVGESATDSFTYTTSDGNGGADTETVTLTINGLNDPPVAVADANATGENTAVAGNVLTNDTDPDTNDVLTVSAVNGGGANVGVQITLASGALLTLNADGSYDYDPNGQFESLQVGETATDSFNYAVSDGNGGTDTATATITINGVNDAPVAVADSNSTNEATAVAGNVLTNDTDVESDVLSVSEVNGAAGDVGVQITLASGALLTLNANGSYSYDPNGQFEHLGVGESATDSFTYTVSDGNGGTDTATATITINGVNDAPVAVDDSFFTDEGVPLFGNIVINDTDLDGDMLTVDEVNGSAANVGTIITLASGATLTVNADGSFSYDDNGNFESLSTGASAVENFSYAVRDNNGGTDLASGTITVNGVNDAPNAVSDAFSTDEETAISGAVLGNDSDVENQTLSVSRVNGLIANVGVQITLASGALLTMNANGTFNYNPNNAFNLGLDASGSDSFTYTASDGNGGETTTTVLLTIASISTTVTGTVNPETLNGFNGNDVLIGLAGADVLNGGAGSDTASYAGSAARVRVNLGTGSALEGDAAGDSFISIENLAGSSLNDILTGNGSVNTISGGAGHDILDGSGGADILAGGLGDDRYLINNAGVTINENVSEGTDQVVSTIDYTLGETLELLSLSGSAFRGTGNSRNNSIVGTGTTNLLEGMGGADVLNGGGGSDFIDGGTGNDTMIGGIGDDRYTVDSSGDIITENAGEGTDYVTSSADFFILPLQVEILTLTGAAVRAIGNDRANLLTGTDLANRLDAHGGNDILVGLGGNDWLDGWGGADQMTGGTGDDKYVIDNVGDVVTENASEGTDLVMSYIDHTLSINFELLTLLGTADVDATGNSRNNRLIGNSGANDINGMGGNDDLIGGAGNDRFVFAAGAGDDTIQDFVAGGVDDTLDFSAYSGTGITYTVSQVGADTVFAFTNGDSVTLVNVNSGDLVQTDPFGWS